MAFKGNKEQGEGAGGEKEKQERSEHLLNASVPCRTVAHLLSYLVRMWQSRDLNAGLSDSEAFVPSTVLHTMWARFGYGKEEVTIPFKPNTQIGMI